MSEYEIINKVSQIVVDGVVPQSGCRQHTHRQEIKVVIEALDRCDWQCGATAQVAPVPTVRTGVALIGAPGPFWCY